ncbi:MAG: FtsX-like permease family protein [Bacteroidota bacterium]|nr:FtsX-like permease family protein [Bacteroidota bacterium]
MYLTFAWRYFKAKKSTNAINIISWVTLLVIAFSTMCQVLVLSVFNGFEDLVKSLYSNFYTDVRIIASKGKTIFLSPEQINSIKKFSGVKNISLVVEEKALLQNGDAQTVVFLKGVDNNYSNVSGVPKKMLKGNFEPGTADTPNLILGAGIENAIGVESDRSLSPLTIFLPKKNAVSSDDPSASLSEGNAYPVGSFAIQQDFDNRYVITNIDFVKQQMNYAVNEFTAVEIVLANPAQTDEVTKSLQKKLGNNYKAQTKYEQNTSLYNSMRVEKWAIYALLTLILIIAAFNMISALTMLVLEKRKDIGVLQSLGACKNLILKIFLSEGLILALTGAVIGLLLAIIICALQSKFKIVKLTGNSFLIDYFPVKLIATDFLLVTSTALIIAFIAAWFPAKKAASQLFELRN